MTVARRCLVAVAAQLLWGCGTHEFPVPGPCPSCPASFAVTLIVQDAVDGGLVNDVTVNGQSCGNFGCVPSQPDGEPLGAGTFSFDVTAPGYAHVVLDVIVPLSNPNPCNCEPFVPQYRDVALAPL